MNEINWRAIRCRAFENVCRRKIQNGKIKFPVYLSAGQEYIPATISCIADVADVFIQHRGHSTYLCFDGSEEDLIKSLLGVGFGGSASISHNRCSTVFFHDGMMGSQIPIAVGYCYAKREPTIVFCGDASVEEDYSLTAIGWAATHNLPILFVVEDNNLSILTEKKVRRSWHISDVGNGMGVESYDIDDDPNDIINVSDNFFKNPVLLNINTHRKYWHAGAGCDGYVSDRLANFSDSIVLHEKEIENKWLLLEKQLGV